MSSFWKVSEAASLQVKEFFVAHRFKLGTVESCTGGMLATMMTSFEGSSVFYAGGVSAYSNSVKSQIVGVDPATIDKFGAVSAEVAERLAVGIRDRMAVDLSVSITGIAGPGGGTEQKPVGLVWFGLAIRDEVMSRKKIFAGSRSEVRNQAAIFAVELILGSMKSLKSSG